ITFLLTFLFALSCCYAQSISDMIKVNQVGYLTNEVKIGYVSSATPLSLTNWSIKDLTGNHVFRGDEFSVAIDDEATEEQVYRFDFSECQQKGEFYIEVAGIGRSNSFKISDTVYNDVFRTLMKGFYYQRSGVELKSPYAGKWARPAEYTNCGYMYEGYDDKNVLSGKKVNTNGGWRDAGDPNKKVVPHAAATYQLLMLYEHFAYKVKTAMWNIPPDKEICQLPHLLTEAKFCLDWFLKMQREDGAVWHAVSQAYFYLTGMGHLDTLAMYILPVSTTATADFAAVMATAYRVFINIDQEYANTCLVAAEKAWEALNTPSIWNSPIIKGRSGIVLYPEQHGYSVDPPGIRHTANYVDTVDADEIYWASAELFIATQKEEYRSYFESNLITNMWYPSGWRDVANFGNLSYVLAYKNSSDPTVKKVKAAINDFAQTYESKIKSTGFGICLSANEYHWGSNRVVGSYAYSFVMAYEIFGDNKYKNASLSLLNYLLGANSLNQTFISGIGHKPVANIYHLPSRFDGVDEVVPGLVPGGPNKTPSSHDAPHKNLIATQSPPPAKCYIDHEKSYASNETTTLECAVWAFVTGYFFSSDALE
ncbi:glycoside hydrolase family 9 protein, partial [Bacteroidales bacterium]|nr:glycoside hydrolase family 9 protein [Bacteroidales bacterium]